MKHQAHPYEVCRVHTPPVVDAYCLLRLVHPHMHLVAAGKQGGRVWWELGVGTQVQEAQGCEGALGVDLVPKLQKGRMGGARR
jgi:hypothetical protein